MATITRDQMKGILQNAPQGTTPEVIVRELQKRGHTIEGLTPTNNTPVQPVPTPQPQKKQGNWVLDTLLSPIKMTAGATQSALDTGAGLIESGINTLTGQNVRGKTINETTGLGMDVRPGVEKTTQGLSMMGKGLSGTFGRNPFGRTAAESDKDTQDFLYGAAKLGSGLIGNTFSPVGGALSHAPAPVQGAMGLVGQGFNALRNIAPAVTRTAGTPAGEAMGDMFDIATTAFAPQISKGLGKVANKAGGILGDAGKFMGRETARRFTGIGPELQKNISTLLKQSSGEAKLGSTLDDAIRGKISYETVVPRIIQKLQENVDAGQAMKQEIVPMLRKQGGTLIKLSTDKVDDVLREFGIENKSGVLKPIAGDTRNTSLTTQQLRLFNEVVAEMKNSKVASPEQFWNTRTKLGKVLNTLEKKGMNDANAQALSDALYNKWNELGRNQIKGLAQFDNSASGNIKLLEPLKRKLFDNEGTIQDKATYVLEQLNNKAQANLKGAVEKIMPGISREMLAVKTANMLKGIESNPTGSGNIRSPLLYTSLASAGIGNPAGFAGLGLYGLTNPSLVTKAAIGAARTAQKIAPTVQKGNGILQNISNVIKKGTEPDIVKRAMAAITAQSAQKKN